MLDEFDIYLIVVFGFYSAVKGYYWWSNEIYLSEINNSTGFVDNATYYNF